jgi:hypothetical protein
VIARIRALTKKAPFQKEQIDVNDFIREVAALTRSEMQRNRVELRTELMTDLPPVQADRIELQQLLLNLIINANEAMSDGAKRDLVIVSTEGETDNVRVLVCDSGRGLDPAAADRIFQAFYTPSPAEWAWGLQSADRLSRGWADSSRLARMSLAAPSLSSAYRSDKRAHRRSARGRSKLDNIGKRGVRYLRSLDHRRRAGGDPPCPRSSLLQVLPSQPIAFRAVYPFCGSIRSSALR